jgi:hypothetical protein
MRPIRTAKSNMTYIGPTPNIGDLPCERVPPDEINSTWAFDDKERDAIARGANIELSILGEPIPPVGLCLTWDREVVEGQ